MSRNLGWKSHHIEQSGIHVKLMNEITDVESCLDTSTQITKELKTWLNELSKKKKIAGKSPQNICAPSNRFNTPILKIQGLLFTSVESPSQTIELPTTNSTTNNDSVSTSALTLNVTVPQVFQIPSQVMPLTTGIPQSSGSWQPLQVDFDSEMQVEVNPQFEIPSFDLDLELFNQMLEQEPIPEPTDAELAAHAFLRNVLGK